MSLLQDFRDYQPTKAALGWAAGAASVLTMVVGFSLGGWVTGGTAERMAAEARVAGQVEIAAAACAGNFRAYPAALEAHRELVGLSSFRQRQFVQEQPWAQVPGLDALDRVAADRCARLIVDMDPDELVAVAAS